MELKNKKTKHLYKIKRIWLKISKIKNIAKTIAQGFKLDKTTKTTKTNKTNNYENKKIKSIGRAA